MSSSKRSDRRKLAVLLLGCLALASTSVFAAERPNILFIFSDDQSFETIGALGETRVQTPNLDRLVRRGLTFRWAYNMGSWSGAVCIASRTMLNTGRYVWHAHGVNNRLEAEREAGRLWPEMLRRAGYRTYFSGKWHVNCSVERAFDVVRNVRPGMPAQTPAGYHRPQQDGSDIWSPSDPQFGGFWEGGQHWSEVLADDAVEFLRSAHQTDQPFFMYLAFNAAHDPRQSPRAYVDRYPIGEMLIPTNFLPKYPFKDSIGCGPTLRDEQLAPFPRSELAVRVHRREYYALITHMDAQIGRILDVLDEVGRGRPTYIMFTSDHGLAVGHHGLLGKQNMYDHSVRVPLIVAGPDVSSGTATDIPVYLQDVMPTSLELAGVPVPEYVDFQSLVPLMSGERQRPYDAIYGSYLDLQRMITLGGFKLIVYPQSPAIRLYHLARDPDETIDLASDIEYRPIVSRLAKRLIRLQAETGDRLDLTGALADWL